MAAETLEQRRDNLLRDGSYLRQNLSNEIDASRGFKVGLWEAFMQSGIQALDERFKSFLYRVKAHDEQVSNYLLHLEGQHGDLNDSSLRSQLETITAYVSNLEGKLSAFKSEARGLRYFFIGASLAFLTLAINAFNLGRSVIESAKAPNLELVVFSTMETLSQQPGPAIQYFNIRFQARNLGDKVANNLYYRILIPSDIAEPSHYGPGDRSLFSNSVAENFTMDGGKYISYVGETKAPVFPQRALRIGNISLLSPVKEFTLFWKLSAENGAFPPGKGFGTMKVKLEPSEFKDPSEAVVIYPSPR